MLAWLLRLALIVSLACCPLRCLTGECSACDAACAAACAGDAVAVPPGAKCVPAPACHQQTKADSTCGRGSCRLADACGRGVTVPAKDASADAAIGHCPLAITVVGDCPAAADAPPVRPPHRPQSPSHSGECQCVCSGALPPNLEDRTAAPPEATPAPDLPWTAVASVFFLRPAPADALPPDRLAAGGNFGRWLHCALLGSLLC